MQHPLVLVNSIDKNLPGIWTVSLMAILCGAFYKTTCDYGNAQISNPHFIIGTAQNNNGCYPVAESFMTLIMVSVALLQMPLQAILSKHKAQDEQPLLTPALALKPVEGVRYWGIRNTLSLHLPRVTLATILLGLMAALPWTNVVMDWGIRLPYDDPNEGEAAAGKMGLVLLGLIPAANLLATCLLTLIRNLNYVAHESASATVKRGLFVDQSKVYSAVPAAPAGASYSLGGQSEA